LPFKREKYDRRTSGGIIALAVTPFLTPPQRLKGSANRDQSFTENATTGISTTLHVETPLKHHSFSIAAHIHLGP